jgi:hypothetical protein
MSLPRPLTHHPAPDINRNGTTSELTTLTIFDSTADATLTLYDALCASASSFHPSKTILLISNPGWRIDTTAKLSLNATSRVDIDPDLRDAQHLLRLAQRLTKREHVNPCFPDVSIDIASFPNAPVRALYRLSDIDDFARTNPRQELVGYVSVVLTQLDVVAPFKRNMLMCNECCGKEVFGNKVRVRCEACGGDVGLRVNPGIVSLLFFLYAFSSRSRN